MINCAGIRVAERRATIGPHLFTGNRNETYLSDYHGCRLRFAGPLQKGGGLSGRLADGIGVEKSDEKVQFQGGWGTLR